MRDFAQDLYSTDSTLDTRPTAVDNADDPTRQHELDCRDQGYVCPQTSVSIGVAIDCLSDAAQRLF